MLGTANDRSCICNKFWSIFWHICCGYQIDSTSQSSPSNFQQNVKRFPRHHLMPMPIETCLLRSSTPAALAIEVIYELLYKLPTNSSWGAVLDCVKYAVATLVLTLTSTRIKVKTLTSQYFKLSDSSKEIGECLKLLWASTWYLYLKLLRNGSACSNNTLTFWQFCVYDHCVTLSSPPL